MDKKVAFLTGGARGIGAAATERLLNKGYRVAFVDWDKEGGEKRAQELNSEDVLFIHTDVRDLLALKKAVEICVERFGRIDSVVANAAVYRSQPLLKMTEEDWDFIQNINLRGVVFTVKYCLPYLIESGKGSIVIMGSDQSVIAKQNSCAYGASKGAIIQFAKSTALDYAQDNIRINAVCPATIDTGMARDAIEDLAHAHFDGNVDEVWSQVHKEHLLGRCGSPTEVANLICFLLSDEASFISGSYYLVDGGYTVR